MQWKDGLKRERRLLFASVQSSAVNLTVKRDRYFLWHEHQFVVSRAHPNQTPLAKKRVFTLFTGMNKSLPTLDCAAYVRPKLCSSAIPNICLAPASVERCSVVTSPEPAGHDAEIYMTSVEKKTQKWVQGGGLLMIHHPVSWAAISLILFPATSPYYMIIPGSDT